MVGVFQGELPGVGVKVEELAVPPPVDGDLQLLAGLLFGEPSAQEVEEEPLTEVAVFGRLQCLADGSDQGRPLPGLLGEDLLRLQDVGGDEDAARRR